MRNHSALATHQLFVGRLLREFHRGCPRTFGTFFNLIGHRIALAQAIECLASSPMREVVFAILITGHEEEAPVADVSLYDSVHVVVVSCWSPALSLVAVDVVAYFLSF